MHRFNNKTNKGRKRGIFNLLNNFTFPMAWSILIGLINYLILKTYEKIIGLPEYSEYKKKIASVPVWIFKKCYVQILIKR